MVISVFQQLVLLVVTSFVAIELAKQGHKVTLSDISSSELELAEDHAKSENVLLEKIVQADARDLGSFFSAKEEYDVVLLLGPLYHLLEESERIRTLEDCISITKLGGFIICSFVTKFAHLRDLVSKDPRRLKREKKFYEEYIVTGRYTRNQAILSHHTHPAEIQHLFGKVARHGLEVRRTVGCEGFLGGSLSKHLIGLNEEEYKTWVDIIMDTAEDPHILSASDHIAVVAQKV